MADHTPTEAGSHLAQRVAELELAATKLSVLLETGRLLAAEVSLDSLLTLVMSEVTRVLDAERSSLFLADTKTDELWSKVAQGLDDVEIRFPMSQGLAGHVARTGEVINIPDAYEDSRFNPEIDRGTGFRTKSMLVVPMKNRQGKVLGVVEALNKRSGEPFGEQDVEILCALANQAGISIENALLHEQIATMFDAFVRTIVAAIDARDPTTSGHSHRVAAYGVNLAKALHLSTLTDVADVSFTREELRALRYAGLLHDVGKIGVREQVLCKRYTLLVPELALVNERIKRARAEAELERWRAGEQADQTAETARSILAFYDELLTVVGRRKSPAPLEPGDADALKRGHAEKLLTDRQFQCFMLSGGNLIDDEWQNMASHVSQSYQLLARIPWPEPLARVPEIAWSHHEKLDGSGYPRGLTGDQFPFEGQILAVADIYDALTASDRPYKRSYSKKEARDILLDEVRRNHIGQSLVDVFFETNCTELPDETPRPAKEPPPDSIL